MAPDFVTAAASDLVGIGSAISDANFAAAGSTTAIAAAGADEVSAAIAALFATHAQQYQSLSTQAATFYDRFVQALATAGGSYGAAEAVNASPLQTLERDVLAVINGPTEALFGRPLIGNGANGTAPGQAVELVGCCMATAVTGRPAPMPGWPVAPEVLQG
ncbi:PE-PGRS family protein PE_PGRS26 [Mycobacterium simulans]|uniref:PE-PGRS family protein PE_PGRS26 n=1 Tax=Mycobacterium simulans TaxID=627089 RepID=A0A7Z7IJR2_9MYCO|nr:PE-PGRS family protein PE_PGRS26 [Mycobacterium simulans]